MSSYLLGDFDYTNRALLQVMQQQQLLQQQANCYDKLARNQAYADAYKPYLTQEEQDFVDAMVELNELFPGAK